MLAFLRAWWGGSERQEAPDATGPFGSGLTEQPNHAGQAPTSLIEGITVNLAYRIIDPKEIKVLCEVGRGACGIVYRATWSQKLVAVKELIKWNPHDEEMLLDLQKEVSMLLNLSHPRVLSLSGLCVFDTGVPAIVMEYCEQGSLFDAIKELSKAPELRSAGAEDLNRWLMRVDIALQIAEGMKYLHFHNIVHADLKSPNVLLHREATGQWNAKVADFGFAVAVSGPDDGPEEFGQNFRWLAPEVLGTCRVTSSKRDEQPKYTKQADVYSFGVVMLELLTLKPPYYWVTSRYWIPDPDKHILPYQDNDLVYVPGGPGLPQMAEYIAVMQHCLHENRGARPQFKAIVRELASIRKAVEKANWAEARQARAAAVQQGVPAAAPQPALSHALRVDPAFCGRDVDVQQVVACLMDEEVCCVNIVGSPGEGKTTLAIAAANHLWMSGQVQGGVYLADLTNTTASNMVHSIWSACAGPQDATLVLDGDADPVQVLCTAMQHKVSAMPPGAWCLLVLDNAEDPLRTSAAAVYKLLGRLLESCGSITTTRSSSSGSKGATGGQLKLLVTSQLKLEPSCPSLRPAVRYHTVAKLATDDAVGLLLHLVPEGLEEEDARSLAEKCDCNPCALRVVAGMLNADLENIEDVMQEVLSGSLVDLQDGDVTAEYQVREIICRTLDRHKLRERRALSLLAIFPGEFSSEAAHSVLTVLDAKRPQVALKVLCQWFIVMPTAAKRFKLHMLVRDYAEAARGQDWPDDPDFEPIYRAAQTRYVMYYLDKLVRAADAYDSPAYPEHLADLITDKADWGVMLGWVSDPGLPHTARQQLMLHLLGHMHCSPMLAHAQAALPQLELDLSLLAEALGSLAPVGAIPPGCLPPPPGPPPTVAEQSGSLAHSLAQHGSSAHSLGQGSSLRGSLGQSGSSAYSLRGMGGGSQGWGVELSQEHALKVETLAKALAAVEEDRGSGGGRSVAAGVGGGGGTAGVGVGGAWLKWRLGLSHVLNLLGIMQFNKSRKHESLQLHSAALKLQEQELEPHHLQCAYTLLLLCARQQQHDQAAAAIAGLRRAVGILEQHRDVSMSAREKLVRAKQLTARTYITMASEQGPAPKEQLLKEAEFAALDAWKMAGEVWGEGSGERAWSLNLLAEVYLELSALKASSLEHSQNNAARRACGRELQRLHADASDAAHNSLRVVDGLKDHPAQWVTCARVLAKLLARLGKNQEAVQLMEQVLSFHEDSLGHESAAVATTLHDLASVHVSSRRKARHRDAAACIRRALDIRAKVFGQDDPRVGTSHYNLANHLRKLSMLEEAASHYGRALHIREKELGVDNELTAKAREGLQGLLQQQQQPPQQQRPSSSASGTSLGPQQQQQRRPFSSASGTSLATMSSIRSTAASSVTSTGSSGFRKAPVTPSTRIAQNTSARSYHKARAHGKPATASHKAQSSRLPLQVPKQQMQVHANEATASPACGPRTPAAAFKQRLGPVCQRSVFDVLRDADSS